MPVPARPATRQEIEELRQQHIGRLFLRAQRAYDTRAVEKLHERGHVRLTLAHTALLANLDTEGTRTTVLAQRAGMTKQAMGQLANDLEREGYITRAADPRDGRATLVTFTERGWQFLRDAYELKQEIETEYATILGTPGMESLRAALTLLLEQIALAPPNTGGEDRENREDAP